MMTDDERAEIALAKIAKDAWAASKPLATGTAEQRKNGRWRAVVRAILDADRENTQHSPYKFGIDFGK